MKKYILGLFAIMFAVALAFGVSAFTKSNSEQKETTSVKLDSQWFVYNGSTPSGENLPENYTLYTGVGEPQECSGQGMRCAIFAQPDGGTPVHPILVTVDESKTKEQTFVE